MITHGILCERFTVGSISKLGRVFGETCQSRDGEVLLVGLGGSQDFLCLCTETISMQVIKYAQNTYFFDGIQHVRLPIAIPIRSDTKINLLRVCVGLERLGNT